MAAHPLLPPAPVLAERAAWAFGLTALAIWGLANLSRTVGSGRDLETFAALRAAGSQRTTLISTTPPDLSLWDLDRVHAWRDSLVQAAPAPVAILRIPKVKLEVAVLPGTSDFILNRAVGHIEDTAPPGAEGNSGIAGHRDGFFRPLKDIGPGDAIELETLSGIRKYRVERIWVVDPSDVSLLDPTPTRALTLVTCYPFYHVGPAPQRYIVRAVSADSAAAGASSSP